MTYGRLIRLRGKFGDMIRLSKSCLSQDEKNAVMGVLDREYLGMGKDVQQFEQELTDFLGRDAVCVVNGTAAVHLALQACNIGLGDEVLTPSLTYLATYQAISATGATPISCDIEEDSCILDYRDLEKRVTKRTKAIIAVHYSGGTGNLDKIYEFAQKHNLRVIEDAAHAFGSLHNGEKVGSFGDIACFSFDGIKNITSGEGGCIVTSDKAILNHIRDARLLGIENDTEKRFSGLRSWEFDVKIQGWRYHMSNIMAAIGSVQLKRFQEFADKRQALCKQYDQLLKGNKNLTSLVRDYNVVVPHIYVVRLNVKINRSEIQDKLLEYGIQTGIHYMPNHLLSLYKQSENFLLPVTEKVFPTLLTLPLHPELSSEDISYICEKLSLITSNEI